MNSEHEIDHEIEIVKERMLWRLETFFRAIIVVIAAIISWQAALLITPCYVSHSVFATNMKHA